MKLSAYRVFRDWHTARDRLNPPVRTPKQDRLADRAKTLILTAIFTGLAVIAINLPLNLLSGDL